MAIRGITSNEVTEYITRDDPARTKEDGATVFYFKPIPNMIMSRVSDGQSTSSMSMGDALQTFQNRTAWRNRECFRFGVSGWDNFFDTEDKAIEFKTEVIMEGGRTFPVVSEAVMNQVPLNVVQEVGEQVWRGNSMTETQRKNFEVQLSRLGGSDTSDATTALNSNDENEDVNDQPNGSTNEENSEVDPESQLPPGAAILAHPHTNTGKTPRPKNGKTGARAVPSSKTPKA